MQTTKPLTPTQSLALAFVRSSCTTWSDFAHEHKLGLHGYTRGAQAVKPPPYASYKALERAGLIQAVAEGRWVAS